MSDLRELDAKGRCCGRKPTEYKRPSRHLSCGRCCRWFDPETKMQIANWAWMADGKSLVRPAVSVAIRGMIEASGSILRCSFCDKSQREVKLLIVGPTALICDECVDICLDIIAERSRPEGAR